MRLPDVKIAIWIFVAILIVLAIVGYLGYDRWSELP
jgi:hypothetical protein